MKKILNLNKKEWLIFSLIFLLAFFTRFIKLGKIPVAFNRDELALAYNAFSIAQTGMDERGRFLPLNIESFGDWKLPGYVYALVPLIKIFGLNDIMIKLPSFLAGLGIIVLSFFLIRLWLEKKQQKWSFVLMFILSILPWGIHVSRIAYEANLALFFFTFALFCFELFKKTYSDKAKKYLLFLTAINFFLTIVTYHAFQIVTPIFLLGLMILERKFLLKLLRKNKWLLLSSVTLFVLGSLVFFLAGTQKANSTKGNGLLILNQTYQNEIDQNRKFLRDKPLLAKIYANSWAFKLANLRDNVFQTFSWDFLVIHGGVNGAHNISLIGNLYPYEMVFILIGLVYFLSEKKLWQKKVLLWLLAALCAPILTIEANHTIRFIAALVPLEILTFYGVYQTILYLKKQNQLIKTSLLLLIIFTCVYSWFYYFISYYLVAPKKDIDRHNWALEDISKEIWQNKDQYDLVMSDESTTSLYIYLLYYGQYDPNKLQDNLVYYPHDAEGFSHVKSLENVVFAAPNFIENETQDYQKILYVLKKWQIPEELWIKGTYKYIKEFKDENAKETYIMFEYEK